MSMTKWLSSEWFEETRAVVSDQPLFPGLSARIVAEITDGPEGTYRATGPWMRAGWRRAPRERSRAPT